MTYLACLGGRLNSAGGSGPATLFASKLFQWNWNGFFFCHANCGSARSKELLLPFTSSFSGPRFVLISNLLIRPFFSSGLFPR